MTVTMAKRKRPTKAVHIPTPEEIRAIRGDLNQAEAAAKVGVGQGVWSAWENDTRKPSRQSAILLELMKQKKL